MKKAMKVEKAIEKGVVSGYNAIENGVVSGYKKIESKFVDTFLSDDDKKDAVIPGENENNQNI